MAADAAALHLNLCNGVEFAADVLPDRETVAIIFRMLSGLADEPPELAGIGQIVESTLAKGTSRRTGRELADAFDALGAQQTSSSGRQSVVIRVVCLPEYLPGAVELVAEMVCEPTFPDEACRVAVELARQELTSMEDDPGEVVRGMIQRLTLGPVYGREPLGTAETLARITPEAVREHWRRVYDRGRLQVAVAGPVDVDALAGCLERRFGGLGGGERAARGPAEVEFKTAREHRDKELKQQQIAISLCGVARDDPRYPVEQVLLGVLSGGMSGRLFTEVREKQGLVYSVAAWHEQLRGRGFIHLRASSTPERCGRTFDTLMREITRVGQDVTEDEVRRARDGLIAQALTQDDVTRNRAASLSEDLFHFGRPIGLPAKIEAVRQVRAADVAGYASGFDTARTCVATLGPQGL